MPLSPRLLRWITPLLLIVGVQLWLIIGEGTYGTWLQHRLLLLIAVIACIPPANRWITSQLDRLRHPSPRTRTITAIIISVAAVSYLALNALYHKPPPVLKFIDERSYSIGMQMAARGQLWMPEHPMADFFEGLNLIVHPAYASAYFPGTAMFYAPSVWLGIPWWVWSLLATGACAGLIYRIATELLDGLAGLLCALMFVGTPLVRVMSTMLLSQVPMLLFSLLMIWAWLRWRTSTQKLAWIGLIGFLGGWSIITRAPDTLVIALPLAVAILMDPRPHWRRVAAVLLVGIACAMPFLVLQLILNHGVTGSWLRTPYAQTVEEDHPQLRMGFGGVDPSIKPSTSLPQKLDHYETFTRPSIERHRLGNTLPGWLDEWLGTLSFYALPHPFLLILIPLGFLSWRGNRWIAFSTLILWLILYALYPLPLIHYAFTALLGVAICITSGVRTLETSAPRVGRALGMLFTLSIAILCVTRPTTRDDWFHAGELVAIDESLRQLPHTPAIVLFKYQPHLSSHIEPVYNTDVPWPDDAPVIRAHDLGERNTEIFSYYAKAQPDRAFYRYDRADGALTFLGLAKDLGHAN